MRLPKLKGKEGQPYFELFAVLIFLGTLSLTAVYLQRPPQPSTWSIVAADPATGEVGIAAASCVPQPIDGLATLVPGQGVAATQAAFVIENRDRVYELLQQGETAVSIIDTVAAADAGSADRQYGIITLHNGEATVAGFTGVNNGDWAGDQQANALFPVSAQGNILEGAAVVDAAISAFNDPNLGDVQLSDRLMRALEAGAAAGGDKRCNQLVQQTAAAAFIIVAQGDEPPVAPLDFGQTDTGSASLHLSASTGVGGANPIIALREQYDQWRQTNMANCASCDLSAIPVPAGGNGFTSSLGTLLFFIPAWLLLLCGGSFALVIWLVVRWWRQRQTMLPKENDAD
ncbi:MAG: DUF1028 domain-containing protein [Chloroflexota bacterium]